MNKTIKRNIWLYYVFSFFSNAFFLSAVLIPFFKEWGHLNQTQIQTLQSFFMLTLFLLEIPTGVVADVIGRKLSLILGVIFPIFGVLFYTTFRQFPYFMLAEFMFGIGYALRSGADSAFIYDNLKQANQEHLAKIIFARAESFKLAGIVSGALFGSFLTLHFDPREIFLLTVIPIILSLIMALLLSETKIRTGEKETMRWIKVFTEGPRDILRNQLLRILAFDAIYITALSYFAMWLYQPKLLQTGVAIFYFGFFHAILSLGQIFILQFNKFFEKICGGEKRYLLITIFIVITGFLISAFVNHWLAVLILIVFTGGFGLSRKIIMSAELNKHISSDKRATANSFINMMREILIVVLNPAIGFLVDFNLNFAFLTLAVLSFGGLLITIKAQKETG